jgi:hypothetical protein
LGPVARVRSIPVCRIGAVAALLLALVGASAASISAQPTGDPSFGDSIIRSFGYPEIAIYVSPDGVEAPATLAAGYYLVTFSAEAPYVGYLDFMQPPAVLVQDEARALALDAARNDLVQPGWVYAGGTNTFEVDIPVSFVIRLQPGEYQIAASYYLMEQGSEEIMTLAPLTVTEAATPAASTPTTAGEPPATVTLEMTDDLRYAVSPEPVPAGPQVWKIANTGEHHAHHVVTWRVPEGVTADDVVADFSALMSGTPSAEPPLMAQFVGVGYAALQSGGHTTWVQFDLEPGTYAVICYIIDPESERPHVLDGMATGVAVA